MVSPPSLSLALPSETGANSNSHRRVRSAQDFLQTPLTATTSMGSDQSIIAGTRPTSSHSEGEGAKKKRGKLFRKGGSKDLGKEPELEAWINTPTGKIPYLLNLLRSGQKVRGAPLTPTIRFDTNSLTSRSPNYGSKPTTSTSTSSAPTMVPRSKSPPPHSPHPVCSLQDPTFPM